MREVFSSIVGVFAGAVGWLRSWTVWGPAWAADEAALDVAGNATPTVTSKIRATSSGRRRRLAMATKTSWLSAPRRIAQGRPARTRGATPRRGVGADPR